MDVQSLAFRTDLALARLGNTEISDRGDHLLVRTASNPNYWWGNYLLVPPLAPGDLTRWRAEFATEFPDAGHFAIGVDGSDGQAGETGDLSVDVATVLTARADEVARPRSGVETRQLRTDDEWAQVLEVRIASDETEPSPSEREFLGRQQAANRALCEAGHGAWLGAVVDGRIRATLGIFAVGDGRARYRNVDTHPDYRRRGLARALLGAAAQFAHEQLAAQTLVIVADPEYHAIELYRGVGFADTEKQVQLTPPD